MTARTDLSPRRLRTVLGPALAAGAVLLAGCGQQAPTTPPGPFSAGSGQASPTTAPPAEPTTTAETPAGTPAETRTPQQIQIDQAAAAAGYQPGGIYRAAHQEMQDVCATLADPAPVVSIGAWLRGNVRSGGAPFVATVRVALPLLCPEQVPLLDAVEAGQAPIAAGSWEVGTGPDKVAPGRWTNSTDVDDCYWERTGPNGVIAGNQFVTHAPARGLTVTVRASDVTFTIERCGQWERVG